MPMRSPHGGLNDARVRAALYYARKRRLARIAGSSPAVETDPHWASTTLLIQENSSSKTATDPHWASTTLLIQEGSG